MGFLHPLAVRACRRDAVIPLILCVFGRAQACRMRPIDGAASTLKTLASVRRCGRSCRDPGMGQGLATT
jgi:hypothetical protein